MSDLYIGLMSGTSLDGIDAVLADCSNGQARLVASHSRPLPGPLRQQLLALTQGGHHEIERMAQAEPAFVRECAAAVNQLLSETERKHHEIRAIGSHGQTIRHLPEAGFTLQIGDPSLLAELTGLTVVGDFRRRDVAAGGQGAPLVPAFHQAVFTSKDENRVIVNVGGMANITVLSNTQPVQGWDTGPGNILMDSWFSQHHQGAFDQDGNWAASAGVDPGFLESCLKDEFFSLEPPKSTGRERFNRDWLEQKLTAFPNISESGVQASLCRLTATGIARDICKYAPETQVVFLCGGGARNRTLLRDLKAQLPNMQVDTTDALGIAVDWVEAVAFAWLARQAIHARPGNLPAVTGAGGLRVLGGIYPGQESSAQGISGSISSRRP